jgi:pimeloyl-ACP methyl ester carboxylesterase
MTMVALEQQRFTTIAWREREATIEYAWLGPVDPRDRARPLVVFLHEGLGSLAMWKDFPQALCEAANVRGLAYSRPGYGASTPRAASERWAVDYLHRQAYDVLPAVLQNVGVDASASPPWLLGHSDGGSIALLHAAAFPRNVAGLVLLAPHVFVEPVSVTSIEAVRAAYLETDLRARLAKYHADVDSAFWGWNDIWLDPQFRAWNIESEIAGIQCPMLAVQGREDEHGTLDQVRAIKRRVPWARILELDACRHSPHRDQPERLLQAIVAFLDFDSSQEHRRDRVA